MNKTFELLEQDHNKVKKIIDDLLNTTPAAKITRRDLLKTLKKELQEHEKIEENFVYPALENKTITKEIALEAYQEHHVVDVLLEELESLDFKDENWKAKLTVLQENLLHHIKEEESNLFVKAQKALSKEELAVVHKNIAEAKEQIS